MRLSSFWGLKFIGFPNLSDETPKPCEESGYFPFVLPGGLVLPEGQLCWILSLVATVVD